MGHTLAAEEAGKFTMLRQLLVEAVQVIEDFEAHPEFELYDERVCEVLESLAAASLATWLRIVEPEDEETTLLAIAGVLVMATGAKMKVRY